MATRTLIIDLKQGSGNEPMYGVVTVQRVHSTSQGNFEVLPWEATLKLVDGKATIEDAVTDGTGPIYNTAYLIRVMNGYCAPRWGFMAALPDGDTPITTGEMPKVNPLTGEGVYMDAQEWNALYGQLPNKVTNLENRISVLDSKGQRGYTVDQSAGRVIRIWDYLNNREQLIYGNTGWRNISASVPGYISGALLIKRENDTVRLRFDNLKAEDQETTYSQFSGVIPPGFRFSENGYDFQPLAPNLSTQTAGPARTDRYGGLTIYLMRGGKSVQGTVSWSTGEPWPTTLPGVAA